MKTNCEIWFEEIAAFAADIDRLSPKAAAHIRTCPHCREKMASLIAVATLHREAAANLPEPKRRLGWQQLEEVLLNGRQRAHSFEIRWRPVVVGTLALALILLSADVIRRMPRDGRDPKLPAKQQKSERQTAEEPLEPTLLALRREVVAGIEPTLAGATGAGIRHYRVRDAENELRLGKGIEAGE
jgi:hypothetical protein